MRKINVSHVGLHVGVNLPTLLFWSSNQERGPTPYLITGLEAGPPSAESYVLRR
jgi:hypothetical protein